MTNAPAIDFSKQTERLDKNEGNQNGPGKYEVKNNFGENVGMITIGVKRDEITPVTPGPGTYSPEKSDQLTQVRSPAFDFSKQPERPDSLD